MGHADDPAPVHQVDSPLGGPLGVEAEANLPAVGGVVPYGQHRVELLLADGDERSALLHGTGIEAVDGEEVEHVGHAAGLEDHLVAPRRQLHGVGPAPGGAGGHGPDGAAVEIGQAGGQSAAAPVGAAEAVDPVHGRTRRRPLDALARGVDEQLAGHVGLAVAGRLEAGAGGDEGGHDLSPLGRAGLGRGPVEVGGGAGGRQCGRAETGPVLVDGLHRGGRQRRGHQAAQPPSSTLVVVADAVRPSFATCSVTEHALVADVLVDKRIGEAGEAFRHHAHGHSGPGPAVHQVEGAGRQGVEVGGVGHPRTPTRTPRNRQGTAGWPVWPTCNGWPLPQLGVPHAVSSDGPPTMSIDPQKWGLMPV